uniref:Uncharacterized protein n=1 Tax=Romanomermis culicivorax TaxID=13658 RepID=A0A915KJN4_ROMCU
MGLLDTLTKTLIKAKATLARRVKGMDKAPGHPTALTKEEENILCEHIMLVAEWGYPMTQTDLRQFVKNYLDKKG